MRKFSFFIAVVALLTASSSLYAQEVKIGAKIGGNYATLFGDNDKFNTGVFDFHGGGFVELGLMKKFALQGELLYSRQGTDNDGRLTLSYVSLPILAKLKFIRGKLGFYGGPQVSYLLSADYDIAGFEGEAKDFYKDFDISLALGADFMLTKYLNVGARYLFSIPSIGAEYEIESTLPNGMINVQTVEAENVRNSVIQVYLGFILHKKK